MNAHVASTLEHGAAAEQAALALESELTELWGHINAATYRFLELLAEFDRNEGWVRHGLASCAQWLNLSCGIGPVAAREKVRVAKALGGLPEISAAFESGQVSYSKVRAMTRVATPENEAILLNVALHGTATHVERLVRLYRRVDTLDDRERVNRQHRERFLHLSYNEDGSVTLYGRLPTEVGALVGKAIEAAMELGSRLDRSEADDSAEASSTAEDAETASSVTQSVVVRQARLLDNAAANLNEPADGDERDPIGARRADALRLLAEHFLADEASRCPSSAERYQVVVHIDQRLLSRSHADDTDHADLPNCADHASYEDLAGHGDWASHAGRSSEPARCETEDGAMLAAETARRLACYATLVGIVADQSGEPLNVGRKTRAIGPLLRRALRARDGGCRFPGCDHTRFTEGHHVKHWANGGETKLANLVTLCRFHHRLLHEGGFALEVTDDGVFVFLDPCGRRLQEARPVEQRFRGNKLASLNDWRGVEPSRPPGWCGERMDYGLAMEAMLYERRVR